MRLERALRCVFNEPWLLPGAYHANIRRLLDLKLSMTAHEFSTRQREGETISGDKVELPSMVVSKGIATIPFAGVLVKGASGFEKGSGALSHDDVTVDVLEALANEEVKGIMFDVDSPGGTAAGSFELSDLITEASQRKPTLAYVERLCCSGALLSLCGCGMLYGSETSETGAVETYMAWLDPSARMEMEGYRFELIKNTGGTHVAAGLPGHPLTDDQRELLQGQVDQLYGMYRSRLVANRPKVAADAMDGRTFIGRKAVSAGLIDAITTRAQAMIDLRSWAGLPN